MTDLMRVIRERRSIRSYEDRDVPDDILQKVLDALSWAPSWANTQCWEVIVIRDRAIREKLQETLPKANPARRAVAEVPVLLALCGKLESSGYYKGQVTTKFGDWFMYDLGLATQNLCLAAHDLGLGTVIVGLFDHDRAKQVLGVGNGYELPVLIPLGYPAREASAPRRREISEFIHHDRF
jgi:nitroreductase